MTTDTRDDSGDNHHGLQYEGHIFSPVGRNTQEAINLVLRGADIKGYRKKHHRKKKADGKKEKVPWDLSTLEECEESAVDESISPHKRKREHDITDPRSPCFRSITRDTGTVGEKSRFTLGRSFKEYNEEHDAPPIGHYKPSYEMALPTSPKCDFHEPPVHHSIKQAEELPVARLKTNPRFGSDVARPGQLLALETERPNLSLLSHRERHLKAMADTEESFTGWTPCAQDAVEMRFPAWDFHTTKIDREGSPAKTFYVPGRYADENGVLADITKPAVKQGRRFLGSYKENNPMRVCKGQIPDRSLSRIVPMLHKSNCMSTLWRRARMSQRPSLNAKTVYRMEDADKVLDHEMAFTRSRGEFHLRQGVKLSPRFHVSANRRTQSLGARIFQGDHAMRGSHGLKPEVSLEFLQLPVDQTAESWGVRAKIRCPDFKIGQGRDKTKRWSKTPQLKRSMGSVCPPFTRSASSKCGLAALAVDAEVLHRMRRTRSYAEVPEWDATIREIDELPLRDEHVH